MNVTRLYRDQLGLSQEFMAMYLQITLGQLAMYEIGKRNLPAAALTKLADMSSFLEQEQIATKGWELLEKQQLEMNIFIEAQIKELEFQQMQAQRKLNTMLKKYNQNVALHDFALHLHANGSPLGEVLLQQAKNGIEKNGLVAQTQQIIKLEGIKGQLVYAKKV